MLELVGATLILTMYQPKQIQIEVAPSRASQMVTEEETEPSSTPPTPQELAKQQVIEQWGANEWPALRELYIRESGFNPLAKNPHSTASGIPQFLDGTWKTVGCVKTSDAREQIRCGLKYIKQRYQSPRGALAFWNEHGWY